MSHRWWEPLALLISLGVLIARKPEALLSPQFYAEDALVFFRDAWMSPWTSFKPYNGYYELLSRLIAFFASPLPLRWAPAAYVWASIAFTIGVCAYALSSRSPLPAPARFCCAIAVVAAPVTNDIFSNVVNLQWPLALTLVLLAISQAPVTRAQRFFDAGLAAVAGLSGPFCLLFAPFFAWRAWVRRDRFSFLLLAIVAAACAIQAHNLPGSRISSRAPVAAVAYLQVWGGVARSLLAAWSDIAPERWLYFSAAIFAGWIVLLIGALRRRSVPIATLVLAAMISFGSAVWAYRADPLLIADAARYLYLPEVLTVWAIAAFLPVPTAWLALTINAASSFFSCSILQREPDLHWEKASACIGVSDPCIVPVLPPGWNLTMPGRRD